MTASYRLRTPALALSTAAAAVATVGDLLLLWVGNATRPELGPPAPPAPALLIGGIAGVLGIPLYGFGYRAVADVVRPGSRALANAIAIAGVGVAVIGSLIHGLTTHVIHVALEAGARGAPPLQAVSDEPLLVWTWLAAALCLVAASAAMLVSCARLDRLLPLALGLANPLALTLALGVVGAGAGGEWGRSFLLPAAPNLAHVAFFALALFSLGGSRHE